MRAGPAGALTRADELIRQVTIECPERGLLLLRTRDEMRMTVAAYQVLYESSLAHAVRKGLRGDLARLDTLQMMKKHEAEKKDLERQVADLHARLELIEKREEERMAQMLEKQSAEFKSLKDLNRDLKAQLMEALTPPKWS